MHYPEHENKIHFDHYFSISQIDKRGNVCWYYTPLVSATYNTCLKETEMSQFDFDVGIIGGGPAGAATAAYLARAGLSCVVFERELFPRPHVGESLVPSSTRVFKDLDFLPQMEAAKFPHKYGAVWTTDDKKTPYVHDLEGLAPDCNVDIRFDERQQVGVDKNHTYHVDRGKFDLMLLQHANKLGATVYDGIKVSSVDFGPKEPIIRFNMG